MKIYQDLKHYSEGSILKTISTLLLNPNFHSIIIYRIASLIGKSIVLIPISKVLMYINRVLYAVDIDYRANLAGGLKIVHGIGIVIGRYVTSKGYLTIYQGVTIGGNNGKIANINSVTIQQPLIEENVIIYTNSIVVGPIVIKRGSIIGAGKLISTNYPEEIA